MITGNQEMQVIQTRQSPDSETEMKTNFRLVKLLRKAHGRTALENGS